MQENSLSLMIDRAKTAFIILTILISLFFVPSSWFDFDTSPKIKSLLGQTNQEIQIGNSLQSLTEGVDSDLDGDGLFGWQEALWLTDPNNKDSDNDGTPDGEEVRLNRNPKKAGPNDAIENKLNTKDPAVLASLERLNDENNLTSRLAKNTLSVSSILEQKSINDVETAQTVKQGLINDLKPLIQPRTYYVSSIKVISDNSLSSLKTYGNSIADILLYYLNNKNGKIDDIEIITEYNKTKESSVLEKLNPKIKLLGDIRDILLLTKVPKNAVDIHLSFINTLETYRFVLENITKTTNDPVRGMIALNNYQTSAYNFLNLTANYSKFFNDKNIIFTNKELGYLFTYYIIN